MSKRKKQLPPQPKLGDLGREVTSDMREFGELVAAAQDDQPAKRLSEIVDWHDKNDSDYAGDVKQKAKALLAAKILLNGYGGSDKRFARIGSAARGHSKKADDHGAKAESEPKNKS